MNLPTNESFERLLGALARMGDAAKASPLSDPTYRQFIQTFPAKRLSGLSLDEYCVGGGDNVSFCWWIERGLEPVMGRYMPGTSRGHILYFKRGRLRMPRIGGLNGLAGASAPCTAFATWPDESTFL